jgi:dihydrodipicolinate synthase/N-acetylneuraminate lyase
MTASPSLPRPLRGIVVPLVTPLAAPDRLDPAALERLIEHVLAGGVQGIFVLGTTGEGPLLEEQVRREVITRTCRQVAGRAPVLVGVTDTVFGAALCLAGHAAGAGAAAVVSSAPYYLKPGQPELARFVEQLAARSPLPLFLYNMPTHTRVIFGPEVIRLGLDLPNVAGLKDSGGDMDYFAAAVEMARARPEWSVLVGPEHRTAEAVRLGGHGGVNGGANAAPRLFVEVYEAAAAGDERRLQAAQRRLLSFGRIYRAGLHESAVIKGLKCALACLGLCDETMTEPFGPLAEAERVQVRAVLEECGLLPRAT